MIPDDTDIYSACLLLTVNDGTTLHLNIKFPTQYPLSPPKISIQSSISHPNVFGGYICASLLNTTEDYTPAYTLKGVCIQMLSFFTSDSIEDVAGFTSNLRLYREDPLSYRVPFNSDTSNERPIQCQRCDEHRRLQNHNPEGSRTNAVISPLSARRHREAKRRVEEKSMTTSVNFKKSLQGMPDEISLLICEALPTKYLLSLSQACDWIGGENGLVSKYNIIRKRETICFF